MSRLVTPHVTPRSVENQRLNTKRDKRDKRRFEFVTVTKSDRDKGRDKAIANVTPFVTPKSPVFRSVTSVTKRDRNRLVTPKIQQKQWLRF